MRFLVFFAIWFSLLGLAYWYVGHRIIKPARLTGWKKRVGWGVVTLLLLVPLIPFLFFLNGAQGTLLDKLSGAGFLILGFFSLLLTGVLVRDIGLLSLAGLSRLIPRTSSERFRPTDPERRRFLVHASNLTVLGLSAAATGYGVHEAKGEARHERVDVPIRNLPPEFDGFRIAQFSDLHVGPTIKRDFVERLVGQVQDLEADLIAFTGDLVDGSVTWLKEDVAPLRALTAPHGVYMVTGNHEYYSGADAWVKEAGRLGFDVLMNEHRIIRRGEAAIVLAGITDYSGGQFSRTHRSDPVAAFRGSPEALARVLLAHQPRSIEAAAQAGFDLQLSGHTHGGQFFPWNFLATLNQPYVKGLHRHGKGWIYVNRGTAYWGPPLRLGIPPEITMITLRQGGPEPGAEKTKGGS